MSMRTRRDILAGAAAGAIGGSAAGLTGLALRQHAPAESMTVARLTQADIGRKVRALAEEMSMLLADLDEGQWEVRVGPPFKGAPLYSIDPIVWGSREATREDLVRYYAFLWCEFHALADELGTEQHDAAILSEAGGHLKIQALFGHSKPSNRALAMLRLAGGRRAVAWR